MNDEIIMGENPIVDPIVDPVVDIPTDDVTLAPTDDVIPAPVDCPVSADCPVPIGTTEGISVGAYFGTLQESVTISWRMHLKTRKHHIHVALNEFYSDAINIVDSIIEQWQGINGVCEEVFSNVICGDGKSETEYLNELKSFVETNKFVLGEHSEINSTIDEFLGVIDSTIYKISSFCENMVKSFDEFCYEELTESCRYDRFGERSCDDPDDPDYDPDFDDAEEE